ncbi:MULTISPECIES: pentapeptide repeat-containing protein [unclassified Streptomyces]|uniref:pentapeptide repeat-containing protein n=1 Tax=unclassified Streptomyces TaxID=2593676 RepID=UPI003243E84D
MASTLPGLAALAAAVFTWTQVGQASKELRVSEEGQITNRFNSAVVNLGASSLHVRIGGIYALGRIMQDSARDEPAVTSVLSAYIRDKVPRNAEKPEDPAVLPADVAAALTVLANRPVEPRPSIPNLTDVSLTGLDDVSLPLFKGTGLTKRNFRYADLRGSDLSGVLLSNFDFHHAILAANWENSHLAKCDLSEALLRGANLANVNFYYSNLSRADLGHANLSGAAIRHDTTFSNADFSAADLTDADLNHGILTGVKLAKANLTHTNLSGADLRGADLRDVDFSTADLRGADLRGAKMSGADLEGAKMDKNTLGVPQ